MSTDNDPAVEPSAEDAPFFTVDMSVGRVGVRYDTYAGGNNGTAQPMPRPFAKGGRAAIQDVPLVVES